MKKMCFFLEVYLFERGDDENKPIKPITSSPADSRPRELSP